MGKAYTEPSNIEEESSPHTLDLYERGGDFLFLAEINQEWVSSFPAMVISATRSAHTAVSLEERLKYRIEFLEVGPVG